MKSAHLAKVEELKAQHNAQLCASELKAQQLRDQNARLRNMQQRDPQESINQIKCAILQCINAKADAQNALMTESRISKRALNREQFLRNRKIVETQVGRNKRLAELLRGHTHEMDTLHEKYPVQLRFECVDNKRIPREIYATIAERFEVVMEKFQEGSWYLAGVDEAGVAG